VRVYRDELLELQVDGTHGSAVAGLRECRTQDRIATPKPVWNPDVPNSIDFYADWQQTPENQLFENAFKVQWEMFLKHVELGEPFPHDLFEGAKGLQLAELALASSRKGLWLDVPEIQI
jgi:predicted dehydrogenase